MEPLDTLQILLIEDDPDDRTLILERLKAVIDAESIRAAGSLARALKELADPNWQPDAVLADLNVPDAQGTDILVALKTSYPTLPVIVISRMNDAQTTELTRAQNAVDHIPKAWLQQHHSPLKLLVRLTRAIERSRNYRNTMQALDFSPSGIVVVSETGVVRYRNPSAEKMFQGAGGIPEGEEFGIPFADETIQIQSIDGRTFECRSTSMVWNQEPCLLGTFSDVTDHIVIEKKLLKSNEQLEATNAELQVARAVAESRAVDAEAANAAKSDFLANMSHELRTPLNAMLVLSQMLAKNESGQLSEEDIESAEMVHESGELLLSLITELLDLAKVESGRMQLNIAPVKVIGICNILERRYAPMAKSRGLGLSFRTDPTVPTSFNLDQARIEQILGNLIGNAVKFTEHGDVQVAVSFGDAPAHQDVDAPLQDCLIFRVQDTGIGIATEKFDVIFAPFEQADSSTTRQYGGTGLGLSISQKLARLMNGDIAVDSQPGAGSCFTFWLPAGDLVLTTPENRTENAPAKTNNSSASHTGQSAILNKQHVLIVDDDMRNLFALSALLKSHGMEVHKAADGVMAIQVLEDAPTPIQIVVTDIMMPNMDGRTLIQELQNHPRFAKIPVIACTARALEEEVNLCIQAGAVGYITKPINETELVAMLEQHL